MSPSRRDQSGSLAPKEVRCEYHTLTGLGSGNSLPLSRQPMRDFSGYIPGISQLSHVFFRNGGRHPPALEVGAGHHRRSEAPESGALGVGAQGERRICLRIKEGSQTLVSL